MLFSEGEHRYTEDGIEFTPVGVFLSRFKPEFPKGLLAEQTAALTSHELISALHGKNGRSSLRVEVTPGRLPRAGIGPSDAKSGRSIRACGFAWRSPFVVRLMLLGRSCWCIDDSDGTEIGESEISKKPTRGLT